MPSGCDDQMPAPSKPSPSDSDCIGCADCATAAQLEKPAPIAQASASLDAPVLALIVGPLADVQSRPARHRSRLAPPGHAPPPLATPIALGNFLRL